MKTIYVVFFSITFFASAMDNATKSVKQKNELGSLVKMPSEQILHDRLSEAGFGYFMRVTQIEKKLASQEKWSNGIMIAVDTAYIDYSRYLKKSMDSTLYTTAMMTINQRKPHLYKLLLKDSPKALHYLESKGCLKEKNN